jgi:hypothetical protein
MIEAWEIEHRPWLYFFLRRFELLRWTWRRKTYRADAFWFARIRTTAWVLLGHETEICGRCGGRVNKVWWCDDPQLWIKVTGWNHGGGVLCSTCFEHFAAKRGIALRWKVGLL